MNKQQRTAMELALQLVSNLRTHSWTVADEQLVITAIKEALAHKEPEQKSDDLTLAYMAGLSRGKGLEPKRTWVGLDAEEIRKTDHHMVIGAYHYSFRQGAEWAEAKLKEKNV